MNYTQSLRRRKKRRACVECESESPLKKQKLSPKASAAKKRRDKAAAMSEWGKKKKRDAQRKKCKKGYDFDHASGKCIPKSKNRAKNSRSGTVKKKYGY
tara:strand:+ start:1441 stop:1737 length:297 start_codon:yes stop_codon:yes gene_type:complete